MYIVFCVARYLFSALGASWAIVTVDTYYDLLAAKTIVIVGHLNPR
ncbi:MAG: hypothetical protein KGI27_09000 [Thaumarchaeota archaeon]|nr:hypothetical protein [Nitrososphaerota archaeon]